MKPVVCYNEAYRVAWEVQLGDLEDEEVLEMLWALAHGKKCGGLFFTMFISHGPLFYLSCTYFASNASIKRPIACL